VKLVRIRALILAVTCAGAFPQPGISHSPGHPSKDLALNCRLEKLRYAEAEPIPVLVSLTNHGKSDRRVPPTLDWGGGMALFLVGLDGGRGRVAPGWIESSTGRGSQVTLAAGEAAAAVFDLVLRYGEYRRGPGSIADRLGTTALAPGRYRVIPSLTLGGRGGGKKGWYEVVEGDSLDFTVVPLGDDTTSAQLVDAFLRSANWKDGDHTTRTRYCADWVPRFYSSGFLPTVFLASGSRMGATPLDVLLADLRAHGASDIMRAKILQTRLIINTGGQEEDRELLQKIAQDEPTGATAAIIKTWSANLARSDDPRSPRGEGEEGR
jgi:hypothetical protein